MNNRFAVKSPAMIPGEIIINKTLGDIEINQGYPTRTLSVANLGDRPIQVGSHYHFYEVNAFLDFERAQSLGFRLNIPAGMAVRFEPGQRRTIELVAFSGNRIVQGFDGQIMGELGSNDG